MSATQTEFVLPAVAEELPSLPNLKDEACAPDCLWPSDNELGIPVLDFAMQANALELPIGSWGSRVGRTQLTRQSATMLFYTEDSRFEGLWKKPETMVGGAVLNASEVNFSVYQTTAPAQAIYQTYRKRWLARYWQECGLRIFVDLNVAPFAYGINLQGVPKGWAAYCTRGYGERLEYTDAELALAWEHAGRRPLFVVYGGGRAVLDWSRTHAQDGVIWVPEDIDSRHKRPLALEGEALMQRLIGEGHG